MIIIVHALMVMTTLFLLAIMGVFIFSIVRRKRDMANVTGSLISCFFYCLCHLADMEVNYVFA